MIKVDCFGDFCPIPIIKIKKELPNLKHGEVLVAVSDHSCVVESIKDNFKQYDLQIDEVMNGVWEITLKHR